MLDLSMLNDAQREAVTAPEGPLLVIAGAGSGKTRTIVHRLAWLVEQGWQAQSILLLTFTRKAAQAMQERASMLLEQQLMGVQGGTFHGFAFSVLRHYPPEWARERGLTVMDSSDSAAAIHHCKDSLGIGKGDRSFPKTQTVLSLLSKARNKEMDVEDVLRREAQHLLPHASEIVRLGHTYATYRREHALLDYDDLLFELETMLRERPDILDMQRRRFRQILVDEYQDTNRVQARLVRLLAGEPDTGGNVMAVGDDAQSIYAFRGATVHNILDFPQLFPGTRVVRLEENYRSVQPVLDIANALLADAPEGYRKHLFSRRPMPTETPVRLYRPLSDLSQAQLVGRRIEELLHTCRPCEIAVLFRAGYQSYHLEVELNKKGIRFRKYGGLRYAEASHVKDVLAFVRLVANPLDLPSFERVSGLSKGVGPKTALKLYALAARGDDAALSKACARFSDLLDDLKLVSSLRVNKAAPAAIVRDILEHYRPRLEDLYPDDWPRRLQGLEELTTIAATYEDLNLFLGDLSLESPEEQEREDEENRVILSTVHSAKGLEWSAVLVLDLVEDRFPSRHALGRAEEFEEERRLMYVACTRARETLDLFVPLSLYSRSAGGQEPATPSPFVRDLPLDALDEMYESYGGVVARRKADPTSAFNSGQNDTLPGSMFTPFPKKNASPKQRFTSPDDPFSTNDTDSAWNDNPWTPSTGKQNSAGDDRYLRELAENPDLEDAPSPQPEQEAPARQEALADIVPTVAKVRPGELGFCQHRIFGRGKIVEALPPDKYRVNFPGMGLKVILAAYLTLE